MGSVVSISRRPSKSDAVPAASFPDKNRKRTWYRRLRCKTTASHKQAKRSALVLRSLIVGPSPGTPPKVTNIHAKPELNKIKSRLVNPKSANRIIAQLRTLPMADVEVETHPGVTPGHTLAIGNYGPIRAVCLEHTDVVEDKLHFSKLTKTPTPIDKPITAAHSAPIGFAPLDVLTSLMNEIHVVDLLTAPDLGIGQPGDGSGLLAGAVPTPETVISGIQQITPQLMALGYATGKAIVPDHQGIYPPTDRLSVLTYWWGLELLLPPPSLQYLATVQSISGAVINFLTALSLTSNGVREILPMVRYIAQYIDFQFSQIKRQDQGKGVVCAATWIMPAALIPRPWDFPDPPIPSINPPKDEDELDSHGPTHGNPGSKPAPSKASPSEGLPFFTPAPVRSILDTVITANTEPTTPTKSKLVA